MRTLELIRASAGSGVRFAVCVTSLERGRLEQEFEDAGCEIIRFRSGKVGLWDLFVALRSHRPSVLHTHFATASGVFLFIAFLARVPVRIAHFRSDSDGRLSTPGRAIRRTVFRLLIGAFATRILAVSPQALTFAGVARFFRPATVIPNGFVVPRPLPELPKDLPISHAESCVVLHVGRSNPVKNRSRAIDIFAAAVDAGLEGHLLFAGECAPSENSTLIERASQAKILDRVHILGPRRDLLAVMRASSTLLVTSTREGLPGVVLEALSVGTPVLASDLPGVAWVRSELPGVQAISLAEADSEWAGALMNIVRGGTRRKDLQNAFARGPFSIDASLAAHRAAWSLQ